MPPLLDAAATTLLLGTLGMSLQRRPQAEVQALHKPAFQLLCTAAASTNAAAAPANAAANAAPAALPLPGATEVHWRAPSLLPISPRVPIAGLPLPTPISSPTSISPKEMGLEDGLRDRASYVELADLRALLATARRPTHLHTPPRGRARAGHRPSRRSRPAAARVQAAAQVARRRRAAARGR